NAFSRGQESARKARPRLTDSEGRRPGERRIGVLFLFGYFLFEHAKRKSLGRRQASETALKLAITRRAKAPLPYPSPTSGRGEEVHRGRRLVVNIKDDDTHWEILNRLLYDRHAHGEDQRRLVARQSATRDQLLDIGAFARELLGQLPGTSRRGRPFHLAELPFEPAQRGHQHRGRHVGAGAGG